MCFEDELKCILWARLHVIPIKNESQGNHVGVSECSPVYLLPDIADNTRGQGVHTK